MVRETIRISRQEPFAVALGAEGVSVRIELGPDGSGVVYLNRGREIVAIAELVPDQREVS